jgi:hypothetical protein
MQLYDFNFFSLLMSSVKVQRMQKTNKRQRNKNKVHITCLMDMYEYIKAVRKPQL